ncbi:MAG: hypothetical protein SGCHY_002223, partial [Lobulomycetales sp.]
MATISKEIQDTLRAYFDSQQPTTSPGPVRRGVELPTFQLTPPTTPATVEHKAAIVGLDGGNGAYERLGGTFEG